MKIYEEPRIEVLRIEVEDVVTTSEFDGDNTGEPVSPWSTRQWS